PGRYRLTLVIRSRTNGSDGYDERILVEVISWSRAICVHVLTRSDLRNPRHELPFEVPERAAAVELRISALSSVEATIDDLAVDPIGTPPERPISQVLRRQNWLAVLDVGPAGKRPEFGAEAEQGVTEAVERRSGYVICGPRWPLAPGRYNMTAVIELSKADF